MSPWVDPLLGDTRKLTLRIATAVIAKAIVAVSHTRYFWFSPKIPLPTGQALAHRSRSRKGRLAKSAVLARRVIKSRGKRGSARQVSPIFSFLNCFGSWLFNADFLATQKLTLRIKTRAFASKLCAHFYLAIFGFRLVEAAELSQAALCDCFGFAFRVAMYTPS